MRDLDREGVWGEVIYASLGLWENLITDRDLVRAAVARGERVEGDRGAGVGARSPGARGDGARCSTWTTQSPSCTTPPTSGCTS